MEPPEVVSMLKIWAFLFWAGFGVRVWKVPGPWRLDANHYMASVDTND